MDDSMDILQGRHTLSESSLQIRSIEHQISPKIGSFERR